MIRATAFILAAAAALPAAPTPTTDTIITSDHLDSVSGDIETVTEFSGHVVVTGTNLELRCDHLHMVTTKLNEHTGTLGKQTGFKTLLATGHVRILQTHGLREATCGRAEVFPAENKIVLTENPVVIDHGNNTRAMGTRLFLLRDERRVSGDNVTIDAPPIKDLGFDQKQAAPGPTGP